MASLVQFCCFSGPGIEIKLRPKCYVQAGKIRGSKLHNHGNEVLPYNCPSLGTWSCPPHGDFLYLGPGPWSIYHKKKKTALEIVVHKNKNLC